MAHQQREPAVGRVKRLAASRRPAVVVFWIGLAIAGLNPPGEVAAVGATLACIGAGWYVVLRLNALWRRHIGTRL